jgi:hypothetical protein
MMSLEDLAIRIVNSSLPERFHAWEAMEKQK